MALLAPFFSRLAQFLLSGIIGKVVVSVIVNGIILGAVFLFWKNFSASLMDYALSFFSFIGFSGLISQIQVYWNQLPLVFISTVAYFELGVVLGFVVNSYISAIFLSWIMRRFGS